MMIAETLQFLLNSFLHVALYSLIPFFWWLAREKSAESFVNWLGFRRVLISDPARYTLLCSGALLLYGAASVYHVFAFEDAASSQFQGGGWPVFMKALIYGVVHAGLSEELLFRGFLCKRLSARFSLIAGNTMQALLFGLTHGAMALSAGIGAGAAAALAAALFGWLMGYINEKLADGSIVSSWLIRGLLGVAAALASAFANHVE